MRIAIITQPLRYNYGGILQNFALQTVLQRMGHEVVTLDPRRYHFEWWQYPLYTFRIKWNDYLHGKLKGEKLSKEHYLLYTLQRIFSRLFFRHQNGDVLYKKKDDLVTRILGKHLFPFVDSHIQRKEYQNLANEIKPLDYDAFIVGSDQVWRSEYNANLKDCFLEFTRSWNVKRIAYAASFGLDSWSGDEETTNACKQMLKRFNFVSVREDSGVALCKNVFDVDATHVFDPTMLLTKDDYVSLLHIEKVPKSKGNLLVYILDYTEDKKRLVNRIAKEYVLIPFRVNSDVEDYHLSDLGKRIQPPVEQWLRGFYDADYVVTDSFHGCIFSIIFGKPFVVYANDGRGRTRYYSLLRQLSLQNCMVSSSDEFHGFCNYPQASIGTLGKLRNRSVQILRNQIFEND